jgi:hypothetical protein
MQLTTASQPALGSPIEYHYDPTFGERFGVRERMVAEIYGTSSQLALSAARLAAAST